MRYRNKLTGVFIDTNCLISGEHWERCEVISPENLSKEELKDEQTEKIDEIVETQKEEKKDTKRGAVIKPKSNVGKKGK